MHKITEHREFPGSPVDRTPCFHCRECWFRPLFGELRSCMLCGEVKKKVCMLLHIYIYIYIYLWGCAKSLWHEGSFSSGMWNPVPRLGIEPWFLALGVRSLSHWITREVPVCFLLSLWDGDSKQCQWQQTLTSLLGIPLTVFDKIDQGTLHDFGP